MSPATNVTALAMSEPAYGGNSRASIPLMPAIRPLKSIRRTAARPMSAPPMVEAIGVNGVITSIEMCNADERVLLNVG